jgi:hypothetical protein
MIAMRYGTRSMPLLEERHRCFIEVGPPNVGLSSQNADILPERLLFDRRPQPPGDFVARNVERQSRSRDALVDCDIWKP